ncbi:MAG TPA: HlyD family secretion protein [Methylophaga aminisulfidivorans]|uniref:HlyD family secretion protein n=2 Tax=root TaxID=1 RepID=A0A7C1W1R5_9GAMM|nr:HlyD family secretion protein [Methylophaga aminisulfidivorans]
MKWAKLIILCLSILGILAGLTLWWEHQHNYPSTDDAYVEANILTVSPQESGRVTLVNVAENDYVTAGQLLLQIDDSDLQSAVDEATSELEKTIQKHMMAGSDVSQAIANLNAVQATLRDAELEYERQQALYDRRIISKSILDKTEANLDKVKAERDSARAALNTAQTQLGGATDHDPAVRAARASLKRAQIALSYAMVYAPVDGWVANLTLRPGDVVSEGQSLFSIVEKKDWWVTANFKETDLSRIKPGQPASITLDMYPDLDLTGTVASIGMGSGAIFSLIPPENATGNWVHVTQRFPVRIHLDYQPTVEQEQRLRAGASVTATVDTTQSDTNIND